MNEAQTRADYIDPALRAAGWGQVEGSRIRVEYAITQGRLNGSGRRGATLSADYVLEYRNTPLAVVEAKAWDKPYTEGVAQAKDYAQRLGLRFAFASNGQRIYSMNMHTGAEGDVAAFPSPDDLWAQLYAKANVWRDRFAAVPFEDKGGAWQPRYYQDVAIRRTLEAIADGRQRILLTLATGTGKTSIAFQIAWKLFHSRWSVRAQADSRLPLRRPRILFLADRNILANQAYNDFSAFAEDALVRIAPDSIRKKGQVPKNGSVFFTIFQTFMSGPEGAPNFGEYPPDFFDFIIIDECHRGGANDEGSWRGILEYFAPAVQLGLTATPKRTINADTYAYFGEPVYVYSLKEGINDGFLTPFKVVQIASTIDEYVHVAGDQVLAGEVVPGKRYEEKDFNRSIVIKQREAYRVRQLMALIDPQQKTLVFCATQEHALQVRDLINQIKTKPDPQYCVRVTADDGALGEQALREFQDNDKTIPTVLTTSQKLSTGVDARNVRQIALLRPVTSMIEFKQIIGRGTRLYEGKDYFTIYDFVQAHHLFSDPEWDGEPEEVMQPKPRPKPVGGSEGTEGGEGEGEGLGGDQGGGEAGGEGGGAGEPPQPRPERLQILLSDGRMRQVQSMMATSFWSADGKPISAAQFLENLFGALPAFFKDEDELRALWSQPETRQKLLAGLEEKGFGGQALADMRRLINAEGSDLFDVLAYVAFASDPQSRQARAAQAQAANLQQHWGDKQQAFIDFVLAQYVQQGEGELGLEKLAPLLQLRYGGVQDAMAELGGVEHIRQVFVGFQRHLYTA
jgi:type I restriction enzyme R subunit